MTFFNALQVGNDAIFIKLSVKLPKGVSNRLHMIVTSKIKKGVNLTLYAKADTNNGAVHLAGKTNPTISIQTILENVKGIDEFTKRLPVEEVLKKDNDNNPDSGKYDDPNARHSKDDTIYDWLTDEFGTDEDGVQISNIVHRNPQAAA